MTLEVGQQLSGKVTGITKFGVFVKVDKGVSGLVHISEVSHTFVNDINDVLKIGDDVKVKIIAIAENGKISFSIKQAIDASMEQNKSLQKVAENHSRRLPAFSEPEKSKKTEDFDTLVSAFLKDSDERLLSLRRNTEGKRGGRGGRRG